MRAPTSLFVLVLAAVLCGAAPATAHEERSLHAFTVLDSLEPDPRGLEVRVVHLGAPALAVRNETRATVTILDDGLQPFLRIGPRGVFANVESPMAYRSVDPASDSVPRGLGDRARWARISRARAWTWFDPRLGYDPQTNVWRIPMMFKSKAIVAMGGFEPLEAHGHFVTELDTPHIEGLELRSAEGQIPALFVRNETDQTLHVAGRAGEPFLRIGPAGVSANIMSPGYYTGGGQTIRRVPAWVDPSAPPRWKLVSETPVWAWLEHRGATPAPAHERDRLGSTRHPVVEWTTPMRLGARDLDVTGRVVWIPPRNDPAVSGHDVSAPLRWVPLALVVAGGALLALLLRRRTTTA